MSDTEKEKFEPVWCIAANVVYERAYGTGGEEKRSGTKHFAPGAKIYVVNFFWGMGGEDVTVVGRHRKSHRYITVVIRSRWLTNCHVELVYSPYVIQKVLAYTAYKPDSAWLGLWSSKEDEHWASSDQAKSKAEQFIKNIQRWCEPAKQTQPPVTRLPQPQGDYQQYNK